MALDLILKMGLINSGTEIIIRGQDSHVAAQGNWYQDDNKLFIDLK